MVAARVPFPGPLRLKTFTELEGDAAVTPSEANSWVTPPMRRVTLPFGPATPSAPQVDFCDGVAAVPVPENNPLPMAPANELARALIASTPWLERSDR